MKISYVGQRAKAMDHLGDRVEYQKSQAWHTVNFTSHRETRASGHPGALLSLRSSGLTCEELGNGRIAPARRYGEYDV